MRASCLRRSDMSPAGSRRWWPGASSSDRRHGGRDGLDGLVHGPVFLVHPANSKPVAPKTGRPGGGDGARLTPGAQAVRCLPVSVVPSALPVPVLGRSPRSWPRRGHASTEEKPRIKGNLRYRRPGKVDSSQRVISDRRLAERVLHYGP